MKNLAIITARSGSKGLPHKNIKMLNGKPLLAWSVEAALDSGMFDAVMVSTDSEEYAKIAREYGAEVPFLRSEKTSGDNASSWSVVAEVLDEYRKLGREFDTVMLLQPTSPLRNGEDIRQAYAMLEEKGGCAVVGACECEYSPMLASALGESLSYGSDKMLVKDAFAEYYSFLKGNDQYLRRQALPTFYRVNGSMYLVKVDKLESCAPSYYFYDETCYAFIMPQENSIDVDTELDFVIAEAVMRHFQADR